VGQLYRCFRRQSFPLRPSPSPGRAGVVSPALRDRDGAFDGTLSDIQHLGVIRLS
jgi:hypothetical protein